jgi:hypothetical protein
MYRLTLTSLYCLFLSRPGVLPVLQTGIPNKTIELRAISSFYGVPPTCITLFDDAYYNEQYAKETGSHFEKVKKETGVQVRWRAGLRADGSRDQP